MHKALHRDMNDRRGKNMAVSVRDRLLNLVCERGEEFTAIWEPGGPWR